MLKLSTDHTHVDTWQSLKQRLIKREVINPKIRDPLKDYAQIKLALCALEWGYINFIDYGKAFHSVDREML